MISIDFAANTDQIQLAYAALRHIPAGAPKALARALNRAIEGARTDAVRAISEAYQVKAVTIRKTLLLRRATPMNLYASIISTGPAIPLIKFNVSPKKPPVQRGKNVSQRKRIVAGVMFGTSQTLPYSFIAKTKSGHIGVFSREGASSLPIKQRYGPSIPQMLGAASILRHIEEQAQKRLDKELTHQINYLFGGGK